MTCCDDETWASLSRSGSVVVMMKLNFCPLVTLSPHFFVEKKEGSADLKEQTRNIFSVTGKTWNWRWKCERKGASCTVGWHLQHTTLYTVGGRSQGCCSVVQGRVSGDVVNNAGWSGQAGMTECGYSVPELIHSSRAGLKEPCMRRCICSFKWCSLWIKENFIIVVQKGESVFFLATVFCH